MNRPTDTKSVSVHVYPGRDGRFYVHVWLHSFTSRRPTSARRAWTSPIDLGATGLRGALQIAAERLQDCAENLVD